MRNYIVLFMIFIFFTNILTAQKSLREKIYLHTDKDSYLSTDTIWYKAYLVDGLTLRPSLQSGIIYIELQSPDTLSVYKAALHINSGVTAGYIPLSSVELKNGSYRLRAFTRWMQNFEPEDVSFNKVIKIIDGQHNTLQFTPFKVQSVGKSIYLKGGYTWKDGYGRPIRDHKLSLRFLETYTNTPIILQQLTTDTQGYAALDIEVDKTRFFKRDGRLMVYDEEGNFLVAQVIPINKNLDIQFLPESGQLLSGTMNTVGIKSVAEDGYGKDVKGYIEDKEGKRITDFATLYRGMGKVSFIPAKGQRYLAVTDDGQKIALPQVKSSGTVIHIELDDTAVYFTISHSPDFEGKEFAVECKAKDFNIFSAKINFGKEGVIEKLDKKLFPNGIARIILRDAKGHIVNERAFFVDNKNNIKISVLTEQHTYKRRDSIPIELRVVDTNGKPIQGSFSMSVTDAAQVYKSPANGHNIVSYMELESDLRGHIETPNYYFSHLDAMDNLLLTQGFIRYDWDTTRFTYLPEKHFVLSGRALTAGNNGIRNANVSIYGGNKQMTIMQYTTTDDNGRFSFDNFPIFDTISFRVQAKRKGINLNIGIEMDKIDWRKPEAVPQFDAAYNLNNTAISTNATMLVKHKEWLDSTNKILSKGELEEVLVKTKKIPYSNNLNGPGNADQIVTSGEIRPYYGKSLYELLKNTVKGFTYDWCKCDNPKLMNYYFTLGNNSRLVALIVDGNIRPIPRYLRPIALESTENILKRFDASDVKSIEVMLSEKYTEKYFQRWEDFTARNSLREEKCPPAYIEITTFSGNGDLWPTSPIGTEIYVPVPFVYNKSFYSPKYRVKENFTSIPDYRSTIYWEPNVVTDKNGIAKLSFYAADLSTTYDVSVEGMDLNGNIGNGYGSIKVMK